MTAYAFFNKLLEDHLVLTRNLETAHELVFKLDDLRPSLRQFTQQFRATSRLFTLLDTSRDWQLLADFADYLDGFSPNAQGNHDNSKFRNQLATCSYSQRAYLHPMVALIWLAAASNCCACAVVSFLPVCAFTSLMNAARFAHAEVVLLV